MRGNQERDREGQARSRCQIGHVPGKPTSSSCAEPPRENVDGLLLCERHALEVKLEGQIYCWDEMLFHIELWSKEARRRQRPDVVGSLEVQRAEATSARHRAHEDLDALRRSETPWREGLSGHGKVFRRGFLPLPPRVARSLARGLGRLRRR
jgi:hypothetical protein